MPIVLLTLKVEIGIRQFHPIVLHRLPIDLLYKPESVK
jgi:hypothetical protein